MAKAILITFDYPPKRGGVARYYQGLVDTLNGDLAVLTNSAGDAQPNVERLALTWPLWPHWLPLLWKIPAVARAHKVKLLAAGELLPIGTALWLLRIAKGYPYIVFVHGFDIGLSQRNLWKRWLTKKILAGAAQVIANSEFTKNLAVAAGANIARCAVVYPALSRLGVGDITKLPPPYNTKQSKVILSVGRLVRRKGFDEAIAVMPELKRLVPEANYVIVGDGPERENLEKLSKKINAGVVFVGNVSDEQLAAWYESAAVFVLTPRAGTTDVEGFGIVYLEAMARKLPVVATPAGGVPEALGGAALFVSNAHELLKALHALLTEPELRAVLIKKGEERAEEFTPQRQAAILREKLYAS